MNLHYVVKELYYRRRRTIVSVVGLSVGIALFIILNVLSLAYREAARAPLKEIGADITVQRPGNVPQELTGAVFPCSAVTIRREEITKIEKIPGIVGTGKAVLVWVFDPHQAWVVLGIEGENSIGPAILRAFVTEGRFLENGKSEALIEVGYAKQFGIKVGSNISVAGRSFPIVGLVDASRAPKIAVANLYLPLKDAQSIALSSKPLQSVSPFAQGDVNLLFIKAEQKQIMPVAAALKNILGSKVVIATPESFLKLLGNLFALSDKFTLAAALIAMLIAILIAFKTMAGNISERSKEIGVMKAVGWTQQNVTMQFLMESILQCFAAGILGIFIAVIVVYGLSFLTVNIPIPWEMSPKPHFLPGGGEQLYKTLRLPIYIPLKLAAFALLLSVFTGGITGALLSRHISKIKPSEVLRHE
jgi:putative ABC transport system permease protein